jgi:hypothetical protein
MELKELFESLPSVKDFDATKLSADDLVELLRLTGYDDKGTENTLRAAQAANHLVYAGFNANGKSHRYEYAWFDDEIEKWTVIALYIDLESNGKIACDFGGMPVHEFDEDDELDKYFKRLRSSRKV